MPRDLQHLAGYMRQHYAEAGEWWDGPTLPTLQDDDTLPEDMIAEAPPATSDAPDDEVRP